MGQRMVYLPPDSLQKLKACSFLEAFSSIHQFAGFFPTSLPALTGYVPYSMQASQNRE